MTEITKQELTTRGLEVTADHTFWIEELEDYKEYLKGMSGVYRFGHKSSAEPIKYDPSSM